MGAYLPALTQAQVVRVRGMNFFDKAITVTYESPNHQDGDYIALYEGAQFPGDPPGCTAFYLYTCGSQDCSGSSASGSITFDVTDPSAEDCMQWPPKNGVYQACLGTVIDGSDSIIECKPMLVRRPPTRALSTLTLTMSDATYDFDEPIKADFTTEKPTRNAWVGVYSGEATAASILPEPILWVYLGCNNQQGDQYENNDCSVTLTSGSIQIDDTSQDRSDGTWPLPVDTYHLCVSLDNNDPYEFFKCFDSFEVNALAPEVN